MEKTMIQKLWMTVLTLPIACHADFRSGVIEGWIVDAQTKAPIVGAIVVADWQLTGGLEGYKSSSLTLQEVVTDKTGHYVLPAWQKKKPKDSELRPASPLIAVFKKGYAYQAFANNFSVDARPESLKSDWAGKTLQLSPYTGDSVYYYRFNVAPARELLQKNFDPCAWQKLPMLTAALLQLDRETNWPGKEISGPLLSPENLHRGGECASPADVLPARAQ